MSNNIDNLGGSFTLREIRGLKVLETSGTWEEILVFGITAD